MRPDVGIFAGFRGGLSGLSVGFSTIAGLFKHPLKQIEPRYICWNPPVRSVIKINTGGPGIGYQELWAN